MRTYIFTAREKAMIMAWIADHGEDRETQKLFHTARRNFNSIRRDVELYSELVHRLNREGRFTGKVRAKAA